MHAQVDSVLVDKHYFVFQTPENWIVEQKTNGEQPVDSSNIVIKFAIQDVNLYGRIYASIFNYSSQNSSNQTSENNYFSQKELKVQGKLGLFFTFSYLQPCTSCKQNYNCTYLYQLGDETFLTINFVGRGKKFELDSLTKAYWFFVNNFMLKNDSALKQMRPTFYPESHQTKKDSFNYFENNFCFFYPFGWNSDNLSKFKNDTDVVINLRPFDPYLKPGPTITIKTIDDSLSIYDPRGLRKNTNHIYTDIIGGYHLTYTEETPFSNIKYNESVSMTTKSTTYYFIKVKGRPNQTKTFCISLDYNANSLFDYVYYKEMLRELIASFITSNNLVPENPSIH
jgi:hypothetical protein